MRDHRLGGALPGMGVGELGLGLIGPLGRARQQRLERFDIVRKGRNGGFHDRDGITECRPNEAQNVQATKKCAYPALCGRQEYCGLRQSIPSSRQASCEAVSDTTPSFAEGQTNGFLQPLVTQVGMQALCLSRSSCHCDPPVPPVFRATGRLYR